MGEPMDRSNRVFGTPASFDEAFPQVEDALVEYTEYELVSEKRSGTYNIRYGGVMPCGNSRCRRGGYEVDRVMSDMIRGRVTEKEFQLRCPGDEGTPKGRNRGENCYRSLKGKVKLKYKTSQDSDVVA